MTDGPGVIVHPVTGEVIDDPDRVMGEYARAAVEADRLGRAARDMAATRDALAPAVRAALGARRAAATGDHVVLLVPPRARPPQRVSRAACERHQEQLAALGVGGWARQWVPPDAKAIKDAAEDIIAAGLPFDELLPPPPDPIDAIVVRARGEA